MTKLLPKSLSVRLLLIFIAGFVLLMSLLRIGVEYSLKSEIQTLQADSLLRLTHIILERKTQQVSFERATRIAQRTGMRIHIRTENKHWSSEGSDLDEKNHTFSNIRHETLHLKRHKGPPINIQIAKGIKRNIYKVTTPNATLLYEVDSRRGHFGWHLIIIAALFIFGLYLAIRYLFSPIANIKHVVQQVSQGNFKARIDSKRQDELGQLAVQVDKMAGDLDRLISSKRSLLLGISHELRTPLTHAKIATSLIEASKHRETLLEDILEMENIITDLTEAERLSEDMPLARQVVNINELVNGVINESFSHEAINFKSLENSPFVNIDPIRTKLLVKNLLKNALQYSAENKHAPHVKIELTKHTLVIYVIDKGIGIPSDALDRLVEPFYRIDQARQRETGGFGLGLYLCEAITKAHLGSLELQSKEGEGTTVKATLSLAEP